jgi:hypothetical protein
MLTNGGFDRLGLLQVQIEHLVRCPRTVVLKSFAQLAE